MFVYYFFVLNLLIVLIVTLEEIVILNLMKFHFLKKKIYGLCFVGYVNNHCLTWSHKHLHIVTCRCVSFGFTINTWFIVVHVCNVWSELLYCIGVHIIQQHLKTLFMNCLCIVQSQLFTCDFISRFCSLYHWFIVTIIIMLT